MLNKTNPYYKKGEFKTPSGIYMAGNSLGPISKRAKQGLMQMMSEWKQLGVEGWHTDEWINAPTILGAKISPIVGAKDHEVIVTGNTSLNLLQLTALSMQEQRKNNKSDQNIILIDKDDFPANRFSAASFANILPDYKVVAVHSNELLGALDERVALISVSHVDFRTSEVRDIQKLTEKAHDCGALTLFDLSHSAGVMPIDLNQHGVDMAVGCTYKYLNCGTGSPGFAYINEKYHPDLAPALYGWLGHQSPFTFQKDFIPAQGMKCLTFGTQPIINMRALGGALDYYNNVDMKGMKDITNELTDQIIISVLPLIPEAQCLTPEDPKKRGGHVAIYHTEAQPISKALKEQGLINDFRAYGDEGGIIRLSVHPFYTSRKDITKAASIVEEVISNQLYLKPKYQQQHGIVT